MAARGGAVNNGAMKHCRRSTLAALAAAFLVAASPARAAAVTPADRTARIGIVSAFGQEADLLVAQTHGARTVELNGNRFTVGTLRGVPVVIVLSGVSMVNSAMVTQLMVDHFRIERLVMTGIAGGVDPARHVGDVTVPDRWAMPLEVYWNADANVPAACGRPGDVSCLGLKLAELDGQPLPPFALRAPADASGAAPAAVPTGLFVRETFVRTAATGSGGEFRFDYPADPEMLAVARSLKPTLARCGPKAASAAQGTTDPARCVSAQPVLAVGGRGVSVPAFLADPQYRTYLFDQLQAVAVEMETAAFAHVAYANHVPWIAFRSLSDLAGATGFDPDVAALFTSGLAETNEAAVTLAFLEAWRRHPR